jgi:hypothetical protein
VRRMTRRARPSWRRGARATNGCRVRTSTSQPRCDATTASWWP